MIRAHVSERCVTYTVSLEVPRNHKTEILNFILFFALPFDVLKCQNIIKNNIGTYSVTRVTLGIVTYLPWFSKTSVRDALTYSFFILASRKNNLCLLLDCINDCAEFGN